MECPQDIRIWISELEGFIKSPSSSSSLRRNEDEVENELERNPYVFEATQITKEEDELGCFKPLFLTIGPLHFDPFNPAHERGNALKKEALCFIMKHDKQAFADTDVLLRGLPPWQLQDGQEWIGVFNEIVNKIAGMEDRIRRCYREGGRRIPSFLVDRGFGWMSLVDACFILVSLYIFRFEAVKEIINKKKNEWPCLHFLTRGAEDATLRMILRDMVILENQLRDRVLKEVSDMLNIQDFPSEDYRSGRRKLVRLMSSEILFLHLSWGTNYEVFHLPYNVRSGFVELASILEWRSPSTQRQPLRRRVIDGFCHLLTAGFYWLWGNIVCIVKGEKIAEILCLVIGLMLIILLPW